MGTENETNKNTEVKQKSYEDFTYDMKEFSYWFNASKALLEQSTAANYENLYYRKETEILNTEKIKDAAKYVDDPRAMLERVHEITPALAFLNDDDFCSSFRQSKPRIYEKVKKAREETAGIRSLIGQWVDLYMNDYKYLLKDPDGSFFDITEAEPDSPQAKAIQKRLELEEEFKDYLRKKEAGIDPDSEEVLLANEAKKANTRIEKYNENTRGERDAFRQFADDLKAVSRHDSKEYTNIINTLNECSREFPRYKENDKDARVFNTLSDNQLNALTLVKVKQKIDAYLNHKAKDGINRNAYDKLAAVEKLNRTISRKLKDLNVGAFSVPITDSKGNTKSFRLDPKDYHETYQEEFDAVTDKPVIYTDSTSFANDIAKGYNSAHKSSFVDAEKLKDASSCIDRIMLRAQTGKENASLMKKIFKKGSPDVQEAAVKETVLSSFLKVKNKLFDDPVTTKKAPVKNAPKGPNM